MGALKVYKTFSEKRQVYTVQTITTKGDVDDLLGLLTQDDHTSIWRGMPESHYKHYTSLQRFWIENDLPADKLAIEKYLRHIYGYAKTWNRGFFKRYLSNYGIPVFSIFSALSVLRHHGTPTPLLDWSRDPLVAMFFSAHSTNAYNTEHEIEHYFSLYEMTKEHPIYNLDTRDIVLDHVRLREEILRAYNGDRAKGDANFAEHFSEAFINDEDLFFDRIRILPIFKIQELPTDAIKYFISNNYNITNQNGLFICNTFPLQPLEDAIKDRAKEQAKEYKIDKIEVSNKMREHKKAFKSYDLHKSLKSYVLKKLDNLGINEAFVFPDLKELSRRCVQSYLESET